MVYGRARGGKEGEGGRTFDMMVVAAPRRCV